MNWLRAGVNVALPLGQQQEEEPSWSSGQPRGCETPGLPLLAASPHALDPAISAGCLMQHQDSPQGHRDSKQWSPGLMWFCLS